MADTPGSGLSAGWVAVLTAITALVGALAVRCDGCYWMVCLR
jgi:hypothetical protein